VNADPRFTLAIESLCNATDSNAGGAHVHASAATLRDLGALLKKLRAIINGELATALEANVAALRNAARCNSKASTRKRGRPPDETLQSELTDMAVEYYTLRIRDSLEHNSAIAKMRKRPGQNKDYISRMMRKHRDYILNALDLIADVTAEQVETFRKDLADKSKPKSARTRK
jgi:hypothetical protein